MAPVWDETLPSQVGIPVHPISIQALSRLTWPRIEPTTPPMSNSPSTLSIRGAGENAPPIVAIDVASGQPQDLEAILDGASGDSVWIYWLKTGCPTCRLAAPFVERLAAQSSGRVRAIFQDDAPTLRAFRTQFGLEHLVCLSEAEPFDVADAWGIETVPSWFRIERSAPGKAVVRESGVMFSRDALQAQYESLGGEGTLFTDDELRSLPARQPG